MSTYHKCCTNRRGILVTEESKETTDVITNRFESLMTNINSQNDYEIAMRILAHQFLYVNHMMHIGENKLVTDLCMDLKTKLRSVERKNKWIFGEQNIHSKALAIIAESSVYRRSMPLSEVQFINSYLEELVGVFAMGPGTFEPIVQYRFAKQDITTQLLECNILQAKFTGKCIEMWGVVCPGGYRNIGQKIPTEFAYLSGFNVGHLIPRHIISIIGASSPVLLDGTMNCQTLCFASTRYKLNYYINLIQDNYKKLCAMKLYRLVQFFAEEYNMDISSADRLFNCITPNESKGEAVVGCESIADLNAMNSEDNALYIFDMFNVDNAEVGLEADGADDFEDEADEGDDTAEEGDELDDAGSEGDEGGDDLEGDGTGDDDDLGDEGGDDDEDTTDDSDSEGEGDDAEEEEEEEEPKDMPNLDKRDPKGVAIEFAKHNNVDSVMYRISLENHIAARLKDGTLNNIQISILKQIKNFWLNYWSIQSLDDALTLVEKLG